MSTQTSLIIGNWKLNPNNKKTAEALAAETSKLCKGKNAVMAIAPPFIYLSDVQKKIGRGSLELAAQDVSMEPLGAFTGEVSALQLKDMGVTYVIVGHSERRAMGETDEIVVKKIQQVLKAKLIPVVCIGEKKRDQQGNFFSVVERQLRALTNVFTLADMKKIVIAYEPIWAIGTGQTATVEDVKEMQLFLYSILTKAFDRKTAAKIRLLYGGSVKPQNAKVLHLEGGMDGFLVGGASLRAKDFNEIVKATI